MKNGTEAELKKKGCLQKKACNHEVTSWLHKDLSDSERVIVVKLAELSYSC